MVCHFIEHKDDTVWVVLDARKPYLEQKLDVAKGAPPLAATWLHLPKHPLECFSGDQDEIAPSLHVGGREDARSAYPAT